ncbi:GNAT family N-acetyltransferase [Nitrospira sp. M1]
MIEVVDLTPDCESKWNKFVETHPDALLYYGLGYRDFLADIIGGKARYRLALEKGVAVGVLPIIERDGPYGRVLNSLPFFGSYGSPLARDPDVFRVLMLDWGDITDGRDIAAATMIMNPLAGSILSSIPFDVDDHRTGQFTTLPSRVNAEAAILDGIDGTAQRNVRRARQAGVIVEEDAGALPFLETIHRTNMAEIKGLAKPPSYFSTIPACFRYGRDWRLYVASKDGVPVAAVLLFYFQGVVEYFTPAITSEGRKCQATALILLVAMVAASERGYRMWNWGGTWPDQDGVFRFKRKWGANSRPYRYFVRIRNKDLLKATRAELLTSYPWFYILPFRLLAEAD